MRPSEARIVSRYYPPRDSSYSCRSRPFHTDFVGCVCFSQLGHTAIPNGAIVRRKWGYGSNGERLKASRVHVHKITVVARSGKNEQLCGDSRPYLGTTPSPNNEPPPTRHWSGK